MPEGCSPASVRCAASPAHCASTAMVMACRVTNVDPDAIIGLLQSDDELLAAQNPHIDAIVRLLTSTCHHNRVHSPGIRPGRA